jgi:hypothetical protein
MTIKSGVKRIGNFIESNPGKVALGVGAVALGVGLAAAAIHSSNKKRVKSKRANKRKNIRARSHTHSKKRGRYTPHTAGKRKDRSHRRIRQTKNGQPYVILANGRARFISKKSAKASRSRSGGRY